MTTIEQHQFKITIASAILSVIAIVGFFVQNATRFERIELRLQVNTDQLGDNKERIVALETKTNEADVTRAQILTELAAIKAGIVKLEVALTTHDSK